MDKGRLNSIGLLICVVLMGISIFVGSLVQTSGFSATVKDLRNVTNSGTITLTATDATEPANFTVSGRVASGVLFVPKKASKENPAPAVVFTHGLYNNREMQEQNAIEAVRRGYVAIEIDCGGHGHNETNGSFDGTSLYDAAKYLYNLPYVDKTRIAVSGHSMGGSETNNCLKLDNPDDNNAAKVQIKDRNGNVTSEEVGQTKIALQNGYHLGIISAGIVQANNPNNNVYGSNLLGVAVIKASSDEFFFSSTIKEETYVPVNKDSVTEYNYTNYFVKKGNEYVQVTADDKFKKSETYYKFAKSGLNSNYYLQSSQALAFTGRNAADLEDWTTVNGGIYDKAGNLLAQPDGKKLVSMQRKGEVLAQRNDDGTVKTSLRAIYEAKETHPMNHFSKKSAAHISDFLYAVFGPGVKKYVNPRNQTWLTKEVFSVFGFAGIFGLLVVLLSMFLETKTFASLKATEEDVAEAPSIKSPRKIIFYVIGGVLTCWFSAFSLKNLQQGGKWYTALFSSGKSAVFQTAKGYIWANIAPIAVWGILCAIFALAVTAVIWCINKCINGIIYKDSSHDEHPFAALRIRSVSNAIKTLILGAILVTIFYGVVNLIWWTTYIDFRFWTFDLRVFNLNRIGTYLLYAQFFVVFYVVNAAMSVNYRLKELPDWLTTIIAVGFNVVGLCILIGTNNTAFIQTGALLDGGNKLFFIACIPIIPCVAVATIVSRAMYKRTGNAWIGGLTMGVIMTFLACANTSISGGTIQWTYDAIKSVLPVLGF